MSTKEKVICQVSKKEIDKEEAIFISKNDEFNPFKKDIYINKFYFGQLEKLK